MQKYIDFHTCPPVPLVVAHRGARGHAPENTLTAAALGYAVQADLWELDANYTKDGKLVVMHDDTLVRTTDVETAFPGRPSYRVCDFTLDEIKSLDAGSWYAGRDQFGRVAAGEIDADTLKSFDGLTVPTLEEALAFTKDNGWYVNVEIKNHSHLIGHETVTKDVLDLIRRLDMVEQVIISSFQHRYLEECRVLCPEMATGALVEQENYDNDLAVVNGHSYKDLKSGNTNLAILVSHNFTEPFNQPIAYAQKVGELTNMLGAGHILVQRYGDILDGKRTWAKELAHSNVRPTLKDAVAGDITAAMPYRAMVSIIEFIKMVDHVAPGFAAPETLLYSPELKFYSNKVKMDTDLETNISGLHCLGDSSGWTRGLMMASVMGVLMGRKLIENHDM